MGSIIPNLSLNKVRILLSYRLILNCLIELACALPHVRMGKPGMKIRLSIEPFKHFSNLYNILLAYKSHNITFPFSSPLAIHAASLLKLKTRAPSFCLTENTIWSFFRLTNKITPLVRATPTISIKWEAYAHSISASLSTKNCLILGKS